ncbi:MAG TPA: NERD domain-containing protein [Bacteroidales bacterium]|nr:DUF2075 domain-containing protein [Bacteroidales bacterium]HNY53747.1 NERD domain-containing protein [Bacteroidales bacterium]HOG57671.1 NERD domain-containing protein [Bacteroidales bacterium]HPM88672.1 NERD domain-containing protein [Bacteroidales bacterium]
MIYRLYNPWHIANSGEKETDKQLSVQKDDRESMFVMHGLRLSSRYHRTRMAGECDFVVLTRLGIMVIEVKGGIIGYGKQPEGGIGYYRLVGDRKKESLDNPFIQVDGNADAIQKYLLGKNLRNIFVGRMVCFPECGFKRSSVSEDDLWHRDHELPLPDMIIDSLQWQIEKFRENETRRGVLNHIQWKEFEEDEIKSICNSLEPEFQPDAFRSTLRLNLSESDRRIREGISILSGLNENRRLIIQGPPGSGKSTYALDIIMRLCKNEGLKGIYLCWNELLLEEMKSRVADPSAEIPADRIRTKLYFDLAVELGELSGDRALIPTKETVKRGGVRECVKGAVAKTRNVRNLDKYDFIVIDEAQDIFDKGIDHVIKALLKVNNPLQNGRYYIFYDDSQDYPGNEDLTHYIRTRDMFKSNAASYNLTSNLRINTGHGLDEFIRDASSGLLDTGKDYGRDVFVKGYETATDAMAMMKSCLAREMGLGGIKAEDCLVLFTWDLLRKDSPFVQILEHEESLELLKPDNYGSSSAKIRYTTMLKAKGLEKDVVVLISSSLCNAKNSFQIFIGASRARGKIVMLHNNAPFK